MNRLPFAWTLLLTVILLGNFGGAQTQPNPSPPLSHASVSDPFDSFKGFSATLNGGMGHDHDRKIHRLGNLIRIDFEDSYRVTELDKKVTWGVDPHSCARIEAPDAASYPFSAYRGFAVKRSPTDERETVDGHPCVVENVTFTPTDGRPLVVTMKLWEAEDLQHFPVKIEVEPSGAMVQSGAKISVLYTDVNLTAPDASLFKHPTTCTGNPQQGQTSTSKAKSQDAPALSQTPQ